MIDIITKIAPSIIAIVALYLSIKKQPHEVNKLGSETDKLNATTIKELYGLIRDLEERNKTNKLEQETLYSKLQNEFKVYKAEMTSQLAEVVNENAKLRMWASKLATQLEQAGIIPAKYET